MKKFLVIGLIVSVLGCANKKETDIETLKVDDFRLHDISVSDIFSTIKYSKLETTEESMVGEIFRMCLFNDTLFLDDGKNVKLFRYSTGKFIARAGNVGKGPGEYVSVYGFVPDTLKKRIEIFDRTLKKIFVYDYKGNYIEQRSIDRWGRKYASLSPNERVLYFGNEIEDTKNAKLRILKNYEQTIEFLPVDKRKARFLHMNTNVFSTYDDMLLFYESFNDTVYQITSQELKYRYLIDFGDKTIPDNFYNGNYNNISDFWQAYMAIGYVYGILNFMESDGHILLSFFQKGYKYAWINKNTKKSTVFDVAKVDNTINSVPIPFAENYKFYTQSGDIILYCVQPANVIEYVKSTNNIHPDILNLSQGLA